MQQMTLVLGGPTQDDLNCPEHKSHCVQESQVKMNLHFPFTFLFTNITFVLFRRNNLKVFMKPCFCVSCSTTCSHS